FADAVVQLCSDPRLHQGLSESGRLHARRHWGLAPVERQLFETIEGLRGMKPKTLRRRERIAAHLREAYVRTGLAPKFRRAQSVASWYWGRILRMLGKP